MARRLGGTAAAAAGSPEERPPESLGRSVMQATLAPALEEVVVADLADLLRGRHAHDHGARRDVAVTTAPAPTKASSPISTPGQDHAPPPTRQARRRVGGVAGLAGRVAAHRVVVRGVNARADEDVVLDHGAGGQ